MSDYKRCSYGGELRPRTSQHFQRDPKGVDGLSPQCKTCRNVKRRYYRRVGGSLDLTRRLERQMNRDIRNSILKQHKSNPTEVVVG